MPEVVKISDESPAISRLDHLGIVAGVCDEIGLVSLIDELIPSAPQQKVSYGVAVKAMILNGLGFTHRTLYMSPDFFRDKPVSHLLGDGIEAHHLHDDCLGSTLDAVYAYGVSQLFFLISYYAHLRYNIEVVSKHLDGTSLSVHGQGSSQEDGAVKIVKGYNKQSRHSLAQVVLQLIAGGKSGIPLFMSIHDGNSVDKETFPKVIARYKKAMSEVEGEDLSIWVADNSLYTAENINKLSKVIWLTRAGHRLKWVQASYMKSENGEWQSFENHAGYRYQVVKTDYGGVVQAALVIHSTKKHAKDLIHFEKRLVTARSTYEKSLDKLCKQSFPTEKAAVKAAQKLARKGSSYYELIDIEIIEQGHYKKGRRAVDAKPIRHTYHVKGAKIVKKASGIASARAGLGKFVLVTNEVNQGEKGDKMLKRSADTLLTLYKNDQQKVERGFRFIKDPIFMLSHIFLRLPRRIVALGMMMCLCLLIYCLAEYKLRKSLRDTSSTLPNQVGKEVSNPTMRWIFMHFRGIHLQYIKETDSWLLSGINSVHKRTLSHLGPTISAYYGV